MARCRKRGQDADTDTDTESSPAIKKAKIRGTKNEDNLLVLYETRRVGCIRGIFELFKDFQPDIRLQFVSTDKAEDEKTAGIIINSLDPSQVALVNVVLDANEINNNGDTFYCKRSCCAGVSVASIYTALKRVKTDSQVKLKLFDGQDVIHLEILSGDQTRVAYEIQQLDIDEEFLCIPDASAQDVAEIVGKSLDETLGTIGNTSGCEFVTMQQSEDRLHLWSSGHALRIHSELVLQIEQDKVLVENEVGEEEEEEEEEGEEEGEGEGEEVGIVAEADGGEGKAGHGDGMKKRTYSLRFLSMFARLYRIAGERPVVLYFTVKGPLIFRYTIPSFGTVQCCLAPRYSDEDDEE